MLQTREAKLVVAILSAFAIWWVWAAGDPLPLIEDEYSYVLQSRIFASGHWTAPAPPVAEFFQQAHVLTSPAVASKFPPGHALLMSVGSFLGSPALVPLILTGITGVLIFILATRVAGPVVALLTWIIWLGDPINLRFRAAYYSEVTSGAMWVISWWALLKWRETRRRRWLLAVAAAIGWGAITRPLTMLAFAVPVGFVVIRDVIHLKLWRDFALAVAVGVALLGIIPLWSAETTGSWRLSPLALYQKDYLPYDKPGFGVDTTPPAMPLMPVDKYTYAGFYDSHKFHTPANLPRIAWERLTVLARDEWSGPRMLLVPFVVIGLIGMNGATLFALACSAALFLGYLSYGHWAEWTIYYFEGLTPLSLLAALGIWKSLNWLFARWPGVQQALQKRRSTSPAVVVAGLLALLTAYEMHDRRFQRNRMAAWDTSFYEMIGKLPMHNAVIFVHYAPRLGPHSLVVGNSPNLANDAVWVVNDLGARDTALMRFAGLRVPLIFHEDGGQLQIDQTLLPPVAR
ncbi:MAG: glycosyltransferase family 39 protein [Gemmatimonadaceae bacterium]